MPVSMMPTRTPLPVCPSASHTFGAPMSGTEELLVGFLGGQAVDGLDAGDRSKCTQLARVGLDGDAGVGRVDLVEGPGPGRGGAEARLDASLRVLDRRRLAPGGG